jgi:hypothetical protein
LAPARAVAITEAIIRAAPLLELARPARSLILAITGAATSVLIVAINGDRPLRSTWRPVILVNPEEAPCLACP